MRNALCACLLRRCCLAACARLPVSDEVTIELDEDDDRSS